MGVRAIASIGFLGLLGALPLGCFRPPRPTTPMAVLTQTLGGKRQDTVMALLPGRKDRGEVFVNEGFIAAAQQRGLAADLIAVDAHYGYYQNGTILKRLHDDVIAPAEQRGYRRIILCGVSIGGLAALRYAKEHPGRISTVVLLSPFLGAGAPIDEIARAGGIAAWRPVLVRREDEFRTLWRWLQGFPKDATPEKRAAAGYPRIILAYGEQDPFLRTDEWLRSLVPAEDVVRIAGVHTFGTFRALFDKILDKGLLELGGRGPLDVIDPKQ